MKTIFYILSVLVIAAAGYFTWSNQKKIEHQIGVFEQTRQTKVDVQNTIAETNQKLEDTEDALEKARTLKAELEAKKKNEEAKYVQLQKELEEYEAEIETHDARLAQLQKVQDEIQQVLDQIDIPWAQVPGEIEKLKEELKQKRDDRDQLVKLVEKLGEELETKQDELSRLDERLGGIREKIILNAKEGKITAVNMDFGFVVVNLGEKNSNITPRSDLLVMRGGRLIARLEPSSVEPMQTVCDLDLDDLTPGVRIQPGDRVILEESSGA